MPLKGFSVPQRANDGEAAGVPIAVHPYDLDSVFLSKSIVSLQEVFAHSVDSPYDLSPLPALRPSKESRRDAHAHDSDGLFSGSSQPFEASTARTLSSPSSPASQSVKQYQHVVAGANATHCTSAAADVAKADGTSGRTSALSTTSPPPQLIVVPLDAYHLMLSFQHIQAAGAQEEETVTRSKTSVGDGGHVACADVNGGDSAAAAAATSKEQEVGNAFAATTQRATTSIEKLSASAPGRRPPHSGIAIVRRVEGDMRALATETSSFQSAPSTAATASACPRASHPTVSRLASSLPFASFDGWVRDHTVYGLSCNAAVLQRAWEDKLRERAARLDVDDDLSSAGEGSEKAGVAEEEEKEKSNPLHHSEKDLSGGTMEKASTNCAGEVVLAAAESAARDGSPSAPQPETSKAMEEKLQETAQLDGNAKEAAEGASESAHSDAEKVVLPVLRAEEVSAEVPARVSPSLERLNCSSTTASSSSSELSPSNPSPDDVAQQMEESVHNTLAVPQELPADVQPQAGVIPPPRESPEVLQQRLWSEERRRAEVASAQLAHRFIVSDSRQHAIWAIEANVCTLDVRVVAPAEFYTLCEDDGGAVDGDELNGAARGSCVGGDAWEREAETGEERSSARLPRKKPVTEVTEARRTRTPSPIAGRDGAPRPRSPSPADPQHNASTATGKKVVGSDDTPLQAHPADVSVSGTPEHAIAGPADVSPSCHASAATRLPRTTSASHSRSRRTAGSRGRSSTSASPSVALTEALPAPLMGGARGFVDGHFSVARFNAPAALCWRVDETEASGEEFLHRRGADNNSCGGEEEPGLPVADPVSAVQRQRRCAVLFISDVGNCAIRYANFHNRLVRTIAGMDGVPGYRDGSCVSSLLRGATALAWCSAGLLFTDGPNGVVRLITHVSKPQQQQQPAAATEASPADTPSRASAVDPGKGQTAVSDGAQSATAAANSTDILASLLADASPTGAPLAEGAVPAVEPTPLPAANKGDAEPPAAVPAAVVPRVWTLAGCVRDTTTTATTTTTAHSSSAGAARRPSEEMSPTAAASSYVDASSAHRARFGYLSDMALWTDETGSTQILVLDQSHHAVRIVEAESGVSTYVGPLDYAAAPHRRTMPTEDQRGGAVSVAAADALPGGLYYPSSFAMTALIKERAPALLDAAATTTRAGGGGGGELSSWSSAAATRGAMLTPQPYLYSSTPLLFVASAVTGVVSMLLPTSQRSDVVPWNLHADDITRSAKERERENVVVASSLTGIEQALTLGVATEGKRSIGEATTPSLKRVVIGWDVHDDDDEEEDDDASVVEGRRQNSGEEVAAPALATAGKAMTPQMVQRRRRQRQQLRAINAEQALQYLRLRFPWVLPAAVPQLSSRLVAGCACHVSGRRRGTSPAQRPLTSFTDIASGSGNDGSGEIQRATSQRGSVPLLPRAARTLSGSGSHGVMGTRAASSPLASPPRHPTPPQRLLFNTPPRHPVVPYTQAIKDPRTMAAAREVAELLLFKPSSQWTSATAGAAPRIVEVSEELSPTPASPQAPAQAAALSDPVAKAQPQNGVNKAHSKSTEDSSSSSSSGDDSGGRNPFAVRAQGEDNTEADNSAAKAPKGEDQHVVAHDDDFEEPPRGDRGRGGAAGPPKWLPPPTKSLSRSPVSTPRRTRMMQPHDVVDDEPPIHELKKREDETEGAAGASPCVQPASYAAKFQRLPPEQRQLRLLQTLEEEEEEEEAHAEAGTTDHRRTETQKKNDEDHAQPGVSDVRRSHSNSSSSNHNNKNAASASPSRSPSSPSSQPRQRSRAQLTSASRSPNNSSGRVSPPLTPRAMAAHQLMQRRRTSRSNTAPHVTSVGSTAEAGKGEASQEPPPTNIVDGPSRKERKMPQEVIVAAASGGAPHGDGAANNRSRDSSSSSSEVLEGRSPSQTVHEAGEGARALVPAVCTEGASSSAFPPLFHPHPSTPATPSLHDAYDAAVRRLFTVYAYFATKTVTHATSATAGAGARRLSHPVEHYSMSFAAFYRLLVLTGYVGYLAEVGQSAWKTNRSKNKRDSTEFDGMAGGGACRWAALLTHVQRRSSLRPALSVSSAAPTSVVNTSRAVRRTTLTATSTSRQHTAASSPSSIRPSAAAAASASSSSSLSLLPLAVTDIRAIADAVYTCGVRTQGYHVVTCMDFQSFRRAMLLLHTWAVTAHNMHDAQKKNKKKGGRSVLEPDDADQSDEDAELLYSDDDSAFAYLDAVPSLDSLLAEDVVAAYTAVAAQAIRTVPALQHLDQAAVDAEKKNRAEQEKNNGDAPADNKETVKGGFGSAKAFRSSGSSSSARGNPDDTAAGLAVTAVPTPPVSPIPTAKKGLDFSSVLESSSESDNDHDSDAHQIAGIEPFSARIADPTKRDAEAEEAKRPADAAAHPSFVQSSLTQEERLALDDLLRLLQRNETTLRQLFDAYSVPVVVHRSGHYAAPASAAAAASVSNPCSLLLLNESRSLSSREVSCMLPDPRGKKKASTAPAAGAAGLPSTQHRITKTTRRPSAPSLSDLVASVSSSQQDTWWKVQQLYTMSSHENKEVFERTSRTVDVMPYKLFVELWRTLDVFPSLMSATAMHQAYIDAATSVLLRGSSSSRGGDVRQSSAVSPSVSARTGTPSAETAQVMVERAVEEVLLDHTALPYPCFVEAFVRVAMTVFSHDVDRVAYPTSAAKTMGLMQWCNKQVTLGLVKQRTQKNLLNVAAAVESRNRGGRGELGGGGGSGDGGLGSSRRSSNVASALLATRSARSSGMFPDHLELFHVPSSQGKAAAARGTRRT